MRLIFIRHGEPDYTTDTLDEKGVREAKALAERTKHWDVDRIYCSPLGRARQTAEPTLQALQKDAVILPWLQEFHFPIEDPLTCEVHGPWDLMPQYFTKEPLMLDQKRWIDAPLYKDHADLRKRWEQIRAGMDGILEEYGYTRCGGYYQFEEPDGSPLPSEVSDLQLHGTKDYEVRDADDTKSLVFFCHFGVTCVILGYLLNISPVLLWQGTCIPTTGVTILNAEKRLHNASYFRMQTLGDCTHLHAAGEPLSGFAAFSQLFQQ